jgi:cell division protease FtsH
MKNNTKNFLIWGAIILVGFIVINLSFSPSNVTNNQVPYSDFFSMLKDNKIAEVNMSGHILYVKTKEGSVFSSYAPDNILLVPTLIEKGVILKASPPEHDRVSFLDIFFSWLPLIILFAISYFSFRQIQSGGNKALGFGKSKAKLISDKNSKVTFADVAGIDEAKHELQEIVDFLKDPQKFQRLGGRIPRGVLLVGPPGTGKTLLAKAIAGEAGVPYFSISGSDFVEMFVGVGASRVRDMFEQAKKNSPCIIFIDEIDAVGRHRGVGLGGGNDEREQTLNQLLVEMDGFENNQGIILIAATNRQDILDPALLRPGRFDRQVPVPNPDINGREQILKVHMKKVVLDDNVDPRVIARGTPGFSGADLANLVNEAALMAARHGKVSIGMHELEQAKDKVMMGVERKSNIMNEEEKKTTAYHEAGHAIVAYYSKLSNPIHKATIVPRGMALGMVMQLPEKDEVSYPKAKILSNIKIAMGGQLAEELIFGKDMITTGAASDIKQASNLAKRMVTDWGMSEKLGFQNYTIQDDYNYGKSKSISEATFKVVDEEVRKILDDCYDKTRLLLKEKIEKLHILAQHLIEHETLSGEEIKQILESGKLSRSEKNDFISRNSLQEI